MRFHSQINSCTYFLLLTCLSACAPNHEKTPPATANNIAMPTATGTANSNHAVTVNSNTATNSNTTTTTAGNANNNNILLSADFENGIPAGFGLFGSAHIVTSNAAHGTHALELQLFDAL